MPNIEIPSKETYKVYVCHICAKKAHYGYYYSTSWFSCANPKCKFYKSYFKAFDLIFEEDNFNKLPKEPYIKNIKGTKWHIVQTERGNYPVLHSIRDEIIRAQSRGLMVLDEIRKTHRAIIAGGAPRDWFYLRSSIKDIDVFIEGDFNIYTFFESWNNTETGKSFPLSYPRLLSPEKSDDGGYIDTFSVFESKMDGLIFQFITIPSYESYRLENYIDSFDFGICKIAFDGRYYLNEEFLNNYFNSCISLNRNKVIRYEESSSQKRLEKMKRYFPGYSYVEIPLIKKEVPPEEIPF